MKTRRVVVHLITDSDDNILMGKRNDNSLWSTVGGHLEDKEDPYQGAARELYEEAGLDAKEMKLVHACFDKERGLLIYLFCTKVDPSQPINTTEDPDNEFTSLEYVDPNEVKDALHVPLHKNIALKWWANS